MATLGKLKPTHIFYATLEFRLFLPQMRMSYDVLVERARAAEAAGFTGLAFMDHLAPPTGMEQPMYEAIVAATWVAARTERLGIGHLVLCDSFRHPAVLARQAVSIDHASGGRFELGIGWGSVPDEFATFGVGSTVPRDRVGRLAETLEVVKALWTGEAVEYRGKFHTITGATQRPVPLDRIPIVIGGVGAKTMALVAKHADWWNVPMHSTERLDDLRPQAGQARVSVQVMVTFVATEDSRNDEIAIASGRFKAGHLMGNGQELVDAFGNLAAKGVERVYVFFTDFAPLETLAAFGADVINPLNAGLESPGR